VGMRMVPADHLRLGPKTLALARDGGPRFMCEFERALRAFVVCGAEALGDHDERPPIGVQIASAKQDAAKLHRSVRQRMLLHVGQHIQIDKDRQLAIARLAIWHNRVVAILIGPQRSLGSGLLNFAEFDFVVHGTARSRSAANKNTCSLLSSATRTMSNGGMPREANFSL